MHRTEGDGFVVEGGKNRFKDQALPTYKGTMDTAEYNNAVQEEICNLITMLGGTIEADAATDRANGWFQIYTLLLNSAKITNAAIADFDLAKGYGTIGTADGDYTLTATSKTVGVQKIAGAAKVLATTSADQAGTPGHAVADTDSGCVTRIFKGTVYSYGPGENTFNTCQYRKAGFALTASSYTAPSSGTIRSNPNFTTDIPDTCEVFGATISYATGGTTSVACPARLELVKVGGFWKIVGVMWFQRTADPTPTGDAYNCIIEYDAASL